MHWDPEAGGLIYQMEPTLFCPGGLGAVNEKISYLTDLGATALLIRMPPTATATATPGLESLLREAHRNKLALLPELSPDAAEPAAHWLEWGADAVCLPGNRLLTRAGEFPFYCDCPALGFGREMGRYRPRALKRALTAMQESPDAATHFLSLGGATLRTLLRFGDAELHRPASATLLGTLLFTLRQRPLLFQGEELGMAGALSDPLSWKPGGGYAHGQTGPPVSAGEQPGNPHSVYAAFRRLARLRRSCAALASGEFHDLLPGHYELYVYSRTLGSQAVLVLLNMTGMVVALTRRPPPGELLFSNYCGCPLFETGKLLPYEAQILRLN